ncbi:acyl-CoA N-acyltransferase [Hypomontagnella submonticulosa]|nr:acyl-CoA N-acyltransferase [Hypomontagnella submonticulosa]
MSEQPKVKVRTRLPTRPLPPFAERKVIRTERLILRPFSEDDLDGLYALRTQAEVMNFTLTGRIDADKEETRAFIARFLPPNDSETYNVMICLASTGEIIGNGGMPRMDQTFGWPEIGYMIKREHWGQGYATEFLRGFVDNWWTLPRSEVELEVDPRSVDGSRNVPDMLTAVIDDDNRGSRRVLEKTGFREFKQWFEADSREGHSGNVSLVGFKLSSAELKR